MNKYNKEELEKLILEKQLPYEVIGKMFNVTGTAIKKAAFRLGIELPQKRKINPKETFNREVIRAERGTCINCGKEFIKYTENYVCLQNKDFFVCYFRAKESVTF